MRRAKRLLALGLALLCLLSLSGCHGTRRERGAAAPAEPALRYELPDSLDESRTVEITFWAKSDNNKVQTAIYESAIRDFEALYPNIRVRLKQYFDYGRIYQDVITNISTNTTPDVCITYPDHIATYLAGEDTVVPLDGLIADETYGLGGSALLPSSVSAAARCASIRRRATRSSRSSSARAGSTACSTPSPTCARRRPATSTPIWWRSWATPCPRP